MNILLDVNIVVDICSKREPFYSKVLEIMDQLDVNDISARLYTGSAQTYQYVLMSELLSSDKKNNETKGISFYKEESKNLLSIFTDDLVWISALSGDGSVYSDEDPEDAQLIKAVNRMEDDGLLLTRDKKLLQRFKKAISLEPFFDKYVNAEKEWQIPIPFCDLKKQLEEYRPEMENAISDLIESTSSRDFLSMQKKIVIMACSTRKEHL